MHILEVHPHIKIGCTPVRLTWEDHLSSLFHSEEFDELAPNTGLSILVCCTFNELRGTFWLSDLVFSRLSDALGLSDNHSPYQHPLPHHVFEKIYIRVSPYLSWILMFCSLTLLRRRCLIGWVAVRVSQCLSILTLTFDWCWIWYPTVNILRWWRRRCRSRQAWQWRHRR